MIENLCAELLRDVLLPLEGVRQEACGELDADECNQLITRVKNLIFYLDRRRAARATGAPVNSLYLAGPMTGLTDNNFPAFHAAAARLRALGVDVENPAENPAPPGGQWLDYMRSAIPQLMRCARVLMLPGWGHSRGARIELQLALGLGLDVSYLDPHGGITGPLRRQVRHLP